jgi:integrase
MSDALRQICAERYFPLRTRIRSEKTRSQYRFALNNFAEMLCHEPTLADLTDDDLARLTNWLLERGLCPRTANERVGRIKSLWTWLAKRGELRCFPTLERIPEPERTPRAWTKDELRALFQSFACERGVIIRGLYAADWWTCWGSWLWNTGERLGASLDLRFEMLDLRRGVAVLPAVIRKGRRKGAVYHLWPEVTDLLLRFRLPRRELVFPWPFDAGTYFNTWNRILERAGLPVGRYSKTQSMRVSHATWTQALGGDATAALGHGSPETTRKSYLDGRLLAANRKPLFIPWAAG